MDSIISTPRRPASLQRDDWRATVDFNGPTFNAQAGVCWTHAVYHDQCGCTPPTDDELAVLEAAWLAQRPPQYQAGAQVQCPECGTPWTRTRPGFTRYCSDVCASGFPF